MHLKMLSINFHPFCLGLNVLLLKYMYMAVRETNTCLIANASKFWAGRVENYAVREEFHIEHIRDICFAGKCSRNLVSHNAWVKSTGIMPQQISTTVKSLI